MTMMSDEILVRWMIRRDMPKVVEIERASYDDPCTEDELITYLRQRSNIGQVACIGDEVVGFILYEMTKDRFEVDNIAVDPAWRRQGVASAMLQKLTRKIRSRSVNKKIIRLLVRETNLPAQRFFQVMGFCATQLVQQPYDSIEEDAYLMEFSLEKRRFPLRNRITTA